MRAQGRSLRFIGDQIGRHHSIVFTTLQRLEVDWRCPSCDRPKPSVEILRRRSGLQPCEDCRRAGVQMSGGGQPAAQGVHQRRAWSRAEVEQVLSWRLEGVSRAEIARRLDRSLLAVKHVIRKHGDGFAEGQAGRAWTAQDDAELISYRRAGLTYEQISDRLSGRSVDAVETRLKLLPPVRLPCPSCGRMQSLEPATARGRRVDRPCPSCRATAASLAGQKLEEPIDIAADRAGRLAQLQRQIVRSGQGKWTLHGYRLPDVQEWNDRFDVDPTLMGRILHDVVLEARENDQTRPKVRRTGRRSKESGRLAEMDLVQYLPARLVELLLPGLADCRAGSWRISGGSADGEDGGRV